MSWREDRLLEWIGRWPRSSRVVGSTGHDAAVLRPSRGRRVLCTDQTIEGVHFDAGTSARAVAHKAVGRSVSDLAATAATPRELLLAVAAPEHVSERWLRGLLGAARERGSELGADVVGGDLARTPGPLQVTVAASGELPATGRPPGRDRARVGQLVLTTGPTGGSRSGRHLRIEPRVAEGSFLHRAGATALIDVSDGLALDVSRVASASGVGIELERIRVHPDARRAARASGRAAEDHALGDGEDHELVATISTAAWRRVERTASRRFPGIEVVGRVVRGRGVHLVRPDGAVEALEEQGWLHV